MLDWELGRSFYVSKHLSLRPHIGIKGGWISQHVRENFTKPCKATYSSRPKMISGVLEHLVDLIPHGLLPL